MLEYLKNYYVCLLILMIFSFLVPKEAYKSHIQFFIGIFLIVLLLKPTLQFISVKSPAEIYEIFKEFYNSDVSSYPSFEDWFEENN